MKIKIVTGYDGDCPFRQATQANLDEYCTRWGYQLATKFDGWKPIDRNVGWRKQELILAELKDCDWLLWLDADCMILKMTIPLEHFFSENFDLAVTGPFENCSGCGKAVFSAGILLFRCCQWDQDFVQRWWDSHDEPWRQGKLANCRWDVDNDWLSCCALAEPEIMAHVKVIPLSAMGHATYHDDPTQFIMHFYGSTGELKFGEFRRYAPLVIR